MADEVLVIVTSEERIGLVLVEAGGLTILRLLLVLYRRSSAALYGGLSLRLGHGESVLQIGNGKTLYFSFDDYGGIAYGGLLITRLMTCYSGFEFSIQKQLSVFDGGVWRTHHELRRQRDHPGGPVNSGA